MKKMSERNIFLRILVSFFGLVIIAFSVETIKIVLKLYFNVAFGGAVPALILYGVPLYFLFDWVGFKKSKPPKPRTEEGNPTESWEAPDKYKW